MNVLKMGSVTRFRVVDGFPKDMASEIPSILKKNAFQPIDDFPDTSSFGFVCLEDMLDNEWSVAPPEYGAEHFAFALRIDSRRVPPSVIKKQLQEAIKKELEVAKEEGRNFVFRNRKMELKEQIELRLNAKTPPVPKVVDVLLNVTTSIVYLGTSSPKILGVFEDLFRQAFGLTLESLTPFFLGLSLLGGGDDAVNRLENLEPTLFV